MGADGSNPVDITNYPQGLDLAPSWSPDSTQIAFTRYDGKGPGDIYVMNADGSGQTNLTNDPNTDDYLPSWSPDGAKIASAATTWGVSTGARSIS